MYKGIKQKENGKFDIGEFKFETEEEAEIERRRIIEEEGLSDLSVVVESDENYIKSENWTDKMS